MNRPGRSHLMRLVASLTLCAVASCASTTVIQSQPTGARLYLNGEPVGVTPYAMTDTKIIGSSTSVRLDLPGYEPTNGVITRNEEFDAGACIGGVFLLFPFLWIMAYKPVHTFEMRPAAGAAGYPPPATSGWGIPYSPPAAPPAPAAPGPAPAQPAPAQPAPVAPQAAPRSL
jgi:PEGA domain